MEKVQNTIKANIEYYDSLETSAPERIDVRKAKNIRRHVFKRSGKIKNDSKMVLELGCGNGYLGHCLAVSGFTKSIISLDISHGMLSAARSTAMLNDIDASQVKADATMLPFCDNSIDFIIGGGFLHHLDQENIFFGEIHRVLKPGGLFLLFREPQTFGSRFVEAFIRATVFVPGLIFRLFKQEKESFDHELGKSYSLNQLKTLAIGTQLEIVAYGTHSFFQTIHWQVAYKLKHFTILFKFIQPFHPVASFLDEKILRFILPPVCFYEISACFRK